MWRLVALVPALGGCDLVFTVNVPEQEPGCLFDDFDAPDLDPAKWNDPIPSRIVTQHVTDQIVFTLPPSSPASTYDFAILGSGRLFDMTDAAFEVDLVQAPDPGAGAYVGVVLVVDQSSFLEIVVGAGVIQGQSYFPDSPFMEATDPTPLDPVQHHRLSIRCAGDSITYQAFDAVGNKTLEQTLTTRIPLAAMVVQLVASTLNNTITTQASFDNVLVDGPNCLKMQ